MDRWLEILKDEPPRMVDAPILHHYTGAFGAEGIISSNVLWATATQFSNDLSEIEYAVSVARAVISETWGSRRDLSPWEKVLVEHLVHLFNTPLHSFGQPFIVSFCEDGDLLSQWRAYGQASGFSLAFRPLCQNHEVRLVCKHGFRTMVKRVLYDPSKQRARLRFLLRRLTKLVNGFSFRTTSAEGASAHVELSLLLVLEMTDWALAVKHESFSEEREWRIITYPKGATLSGVTPENYEGVSIRATSKLLLPYMILEPLSGKRLPLIGVRCGPSHLQEQSARAMNILLRKHGYNNLPITVSSVPLRT
jgi:hypothetical protein